MSIDQKERNRLLNELDSVALSDMDARTRLERLGEYVLVTGMHRSGTSAVAGVLHALGYQLTQEDDLLPPDSHNERGYFESKALALLNGRLLSLFGGGWDRPPSWKSLDQGLAKLVEDPAVVKGALRVLLGVTPAEGPFVWKDPRLCLTLPFWSEILHHPSATIFVFRHPDEVSRSLGKIHGLSSFQAESLWKHYNWSALQNMKGRPVFVVEFADLISDRRREIGVIAEFVSARSSFEIGSLDSAVEVIDPTLKHESLPSDYEMSKEAISLYQSLRDLKGAHESLEVPVGPEEYFGRGNQGAWSERVG